MQPINYSLDVASPMDSALKGLQTGWAVKDRQQAQALQQQQLQQQQQMQADLGELYQNKNPSAMDYVKIITKYPSLSEKLKDSMGQVSEENRQQKTNTALQVVSALNSGKPEIAQRVLQQQEEALRNAGRTQEADAVANNREMIGMDPELAKHTGMLMLSGTMGDKFSSVYDSMTKTPLDVEKSKIEIGNLPEKLALDNVKAAEEIQTKRLDRKLNILDGKIKAADSETKRGQLQLEREKTQIERDKLVVDKGQKATDKQAAAQDRLDTVGNALDTVNKIAQNAQLDDSFMRRNDLPNTGVGSVIGWMNQFRPGSDRKDLDTLVDTLKSQQFLDQLAKLKSGGNGSSGLGAMTKEEGEVLKGAIAKLDPNSSPAVFNTALKTIQTNLERIQKKLVAEGNLPQTNEKTGKTFVMNHPKLGTVTDALINKMLVDNPGATRQQVIQYLEQTGGK